MREVTKTLTAGKEFESDATALQTTTAPSVCYWEGDGEDVNLQQKDYEGTNKSICCVTPRGCGPAADPGRLVKVGYILRIPGGLAWGKKHTLAEDLFYNHSRFTEEPAEMQLDDRKMNVLKV